MKKISLNGAWRCHGFSPDGKTLNIDANVPGCVHTDLMNAGIIGDIFWRYNGDDVQWIDKWAWRYEREFEVTEYTADAYLEFDGLDVYCDVFLNGERIGSGDNMFIKYRFPTKGLLHKGTNRLAVVFHSPVLRTYALPEREGAFTCERLYTRREQCTYSWDWSNRYITCGIYKDVNLCCPDSANIENICVRTLGVDSFGAQVQYEAELDMRESRMACVKIIAPNGSVAYERSFMAVENYVDDVADIENPQLWNVNGMGEQPLYTLQIRLADGDVRETKFGIRTVKLLQQKDKQGSENYQKCMEIKKGVHVSGDESEWDRNTEFSGFTLVVNGERVMCKGANWVPCEPFASAERKEKIRELLLLAKDSGVNMLRVWGGGIFEQDFFYDECDRLGICVTQDFMMACGSYPESDDDFLKELAEEAKCAAIRLRNHPSIVWWSGDNENAMGADESMAAYRGRRAAMLAIRPVLKKYDPDRRFLPSSPYGGVPYGSITKGTSHNTNFIAQMFQYIQNHDLNDYMGFFEQYLARFNAEQPTMGVPALTSLRKFLSKEDIIEHKEDVWRYHTKNNPAGIFRETEIFDYLRIITEKVFGEFKSSADRLFKMQYVQYEWIRVCMELYRRNKWFSSGLLFWMWNDIWPATGWALVDYYALPKAAYYGFKKTAKPVAVSIEQKGGSYSVYVCNDTRNDLHGSGKIWVQNFKTAAKEHICAFEFTAAANSSAAVYTADGLSQDADSLLMCEIQSDGGNDRSFRFDKRPQDKNFPQTRVEIVERSADSITLAAENYAHAVMLDGEYVFEDNCFCMLPGERKTVKFRRAFESKCDEITVTWLGAE